MTYYNITITHITSKVIRIFDKSKPSSLLTPVTDYLIIFYRSYSQVHHLFVDLYIYLSLTQNHTFLKAS